MEVLEKDENRCIVAVGFQDADGDAILRNATAIFEISVSDYYTWKRNIEFCKDYSQHEMKQDCYKGISIIEADLPTIVDAAKNKEMSLDEIEKKYGDAVESCGLHNVYECCNAHGLITVEADYLQVAGYATTDSIHITQLEELFKDYIEKEVEEEPQPKMTREDFMEFWRSDDMPELLTADDRMEIFASAPVGASDISKETLDEIISDYGVEHLKVVDSTPEIDSSVSEKKLRVWLERRSDLTLDNEQYAVGADTIAEAVELFERARVENNFGASEYCFAETGYIVTNYNDHRIAAISYNGRVWNRLYSQDNLGRIEILPENFEKHQKCFEEVPKDEVGFKVGEVYDYGRIHAMISNTTLTTSEDSSHVYGESEIRILDKERHLFARLVLFDNSEPMSNSSEYKCTYIDNEESRMPLRKRRLILDALEHHGVGWFVNFKKNNVLNAINGILYNKRQEAEDRCEKVFVYNTEEEILDAIYKWKFKKELKTPTLIGTGNVPKSALKEDDDGAIATKGMLKLNGREISLLTEATYKGEAMIDWDKYDFVSLVNPDDEHSDVYSWKKSWIANIL